MRSAAIPPLVASAQRTAPVAGAKCSPARGSSRVKRMSEKCPSGGIARRSTTRTPPCCAAHCARRSQRNSGRQPSRRASGANHRSKDARRPVSAPSGHKLWGLRLCRVPPPSLPPSHHRRYRDRGFINALRRDQRETRAGPTPTNISTNSEPEMEKNGTLAWSATALASSVFNRYETGSACSSRSSGCSSAWQKASAFSP